MTHVSDLDEACRVLEMRTGEIPVAHVVLGSGLGGLAEDVEDATVVPFAELPGFPRTTVAGHDGRFTGGRIGGVPVLLQSGRFHFYEGVGAETVTAPIRLGHRLGARVLVVTNAAGGIRRDLVPGDLMLIDDHVNLMFRSPLAGPVGPGETRFPDMSAPYDAELMVRAETAAAALGLRLSRGVYGGVLGPAYETPAEVRALARAGIDAVGMSTVPEVICARALGTRVLGISLIANRASGPGSAVLGHEEVVDAARRASGSLRGIVAGVVAALERSR